MMSRVFPVGAALLASLTAASACLAADRPGGIGKGSLGGQLGASSFRVDRALGSNWFDDYSDGARPRLAFDAHWRYDVSPSLRWQVGTGLTWAGYHRRTPAPFADPNYPGDAFKENTLSILVPVTAQLQAVIRRGSWIYYAGGGPGVYRVWVENRRKVLKDPVTLRLHRGLYAGGSFQLGAERFLKGFTGTSLELAVDGHVAMSRRDQQFPSGYNSNVMAVEVRIGGNYYFTPGTRRAPPATKAPKIP